MTGQPEVAAFRKSVTWRVLSTREHDTSAGYWTASYMDRRDAVEHAATMDGARAYEVTDEFMWEGDKIVQHVSETWRLLL